MAKLPTESGHFVSEQRFKGVTWSFGDVPSEASEVCRQLEKAEALRRQGEFDRAYTLCEPLVARYPDYYGALHTLGLIYADRGQYPQALVCLVRAVMLNPRSWQALTALSTVYLELGASEMAGQSLEQARLINPRDPNILAMVGELYRAEREYELAYVAYRNALDLEPNLEIAAIGLGMCSLHLGRDAEAAMIFAGLVKRGVRSLALITALADLPPAFVSMDVLSVLESTTPAQHENKSEFEHSIAMIKVAALDRSGRPNEAWQHLVATNRSIYLTRQNDVRDARETQQRSLARVKDKRIEPARQGYKTISLFILGPSRSGKTTMETLTATLTGVKRGYENQIVENAVRRTFQSAGFLTKSALEELPLKLDSLCCEIYLEELSRRAGTAKVFTNTHPVRILDVTRVAAVFPGTRFIFVKRNIEDNILRIFMRKYAAGNPYSYDLKATREHLLWYHEMIDTLAEKLTDISRVIHYEDIIADPAAALKMAAALCGLEPAVGPLPELGDDRNCAAPYRALMAAALES